jgi:hypothetical protein
MVQSPTSALPPEVRKLLGEVPTRTTTSLEEAGFDAPEPPSDQPTAPLDEEPAQPMSQDPKLDYFLRQSGGMRGKRSSTTVSDAELTELLATLER